MIVIIQTIQTIQMLYPENRILFQPICLTFTTFIYIFVCWSISIINMFSRIYITIYLYRKYNNSMGCIIHFGYNVFNISNKFINSNSIHNEIIIQSKHSVLFAIILIIPHLSFAYAFIRKFALWYNWSCNKLGHHNWYVHRFIVPCYVMHVL